MTTNYFKCGAVSLITVCAFFQSSLFGQKTDFEKELKRFESWVANDQALQLKALGDPQVQDYIAIAERAEKRIFTPENNELRKLARDVEAKLIRLQTSDVGRWAGTQPDLVATFIQLDTENIDLNDTALNLRRQRLRASVDSLKRYQPSTQGKFNPRNNDAVLAILQDYNWVEEHYRKLTDRLALLGDLETRFPRGQDVSGLPTLKERKQERIARLFEQRMSAEQKGRDEAIKLSAARIQDSVFEREMRKTETKIAGDEQLARIKNRLIEAEFGRRATEIEKRIMATQLRQQETETEIVNMKAESKQNRLEAYLSSPRVRGLLSPFCSPGWEEAHPGAGHKKINALKEGPMSYSRLSRYNCLAPNRRAMSELFKIANNPRNDRGGWGVTIDNYSSDEPAFENMEGEKVNRYIEAQRILREDNATLIKLGLLRK